MGPPAAEVAIREAMSMGIDSGILLSDKKFAGADTWATSCAVAGAIRKIGDFDLIICGERATDGDTRRTSPVDSPRPGTRDSEQASARKDNA